VKKIYIITSILLFCFALASCTSNSTSTETSAPLTRGNQVPIASHLEGVIFNARFLNIPTYENSGQATHPHVLFFEEKFMGFHYIMAMTPYPFSNSRYENPSILGSQCGIVWEVPEGVVNPVTGIPFDAARGGYFSDPFIFRNGDILELWFRHTLASNVTGWRQAGSNTHNRIYRTTTTDLINWSEPAIIIDCEHNINHFMSKVVMYDGITHRLWYTNFYSVLYIIESQDMVSWGERTRVTADLGGLGIWHHDIVFTGEGYEGLFTSADWGNRPQFRVFYATSHNGLDFGIGREIVIQDISPKLSRMTVYKSTFVKVDGVYQMYFALNRREAWGLFYFEIAEEHFYRLFE